MMINTNQKLKNEVKCLDEEAELAVLASCILNIDASQIAVEQLEPKHFGDNRNNLIFASIKNLVANSAQVSRINIHKDLLKTGNSEMAGGLDYLVQMTEFMPIVEDIWAFVNLVKQAYGRRILAEICNKYAQGALNHQYPISSIIADLTQEIADIDYEIIDRTNWIDDYDKWHIEEQKRKSDPTKYSQWVFPSLQKAGKGFPGYMLIVLGGHSHSGKTALMVNDFQDKIRRGIPAMLVSYETMKWHLAESAVRFAFKGYLPYNSDAHRQIRDELNKPYAVVIDNSPSLSQLIVHINRAVTMHKIQIVYIDYLGLLANETPREKGVLEASHIEYIANKLKNIAMRERIDIVLGAQFRNDDRKEKRRPRKSDLYGSSQIESAADQIYIISNVSDWDKHEEVLRVHKKDEDGRILETHVIVELAKDKLGGNLIDSHFRWDGVNKIFSEFNEGNTMIIR